VTEVGFEALYGEAGCEVLFVEVGCEALVGGTGLGDLER
jgi:hypothetical protein